MRHRTDGASQSDQSCSIKNETEKSTTEHVALKVNGVKSVKNQIAVPPVGQLRAI